MTPERPLRLVGGVVAHNEEMRIGRAIRSLTGQLLPPGAEWGDIWVVASGCTDRTVEVIRAEAREDARVHCVLQPTREGKSAALAEIFSRAHGDWLVLLNGDARAEPGAVAALLSDALSGSVRPGAVMGRPVPEAEGGNFREAVRLLWSIHDRFHAEEIARGSAGHLSDELLMLAADALPPVGPGIINDGAFIGAWLRERGGRLGYAREARVTIATPRTIRDHLRQRRRILYGHAQVRELVGRAPSTVEQLARVHPVAALKLVLGVSRHRPQAARALVELALAESVALLLAVVDRSASRIDHTRWRRIDDRPVSGPSASRVPVRTESRTE